MKIYNTLSKQLETFTPIEKGKVKIYQCGPTVYWVQHLGNMRAMVAADFIVRTLKYLGYDVEFTRNYTDFGHLVSDADEGEDKIEKGAKREGLSPQEIADKYIKIFNEDVAELNTIKPNHPTRATDYIQEMIEMVQVLLDKGYAYLTPEAIYFSVEKFPSYNDLNRMNLDNMLEGAGSGELGEVNKKHPADFALWFFRTGTHASTSLYWESPFESPAVENGVGTPGWHIECSAMAISSLGETLDIHMGGVEHISIHHTNEIAQSESYTGKKFANYWLHNEHLTVAGGKMSKSEGTSYTLADIVEHGYKPAHLRYLFAQAHYRSKQDFTWDTLESSRTAYDRLITRLGKMKSDGGSVNEVYKGKFVSALEDDFGMPQAVAALWELVGAQDIETADIYATAMDFDKVLGLELENAVNESLKADSDIPDSVQKLVDERKAARESKDYEASDRLRDEIDALGFIVMDSAEGQTLKKK